MYGPSVAAPPPRATTCHRGRNIGTRGRATRGRGAQPAPTTAAPKIQTTSTAIASRTAARHAKLDPEKPGAPGPGGVRAGRSMPRVSPPHRQDATSGEQAARVPVAGVADAGHREEVTTAARLQVVRLPMRASVGASLAPFKQRRTSTTAIEGGAGPAGEPRDGRRRISGDFPSHRRNIHQKPLQSRPFAVRPPFPSPPLTFAPYPAQTPRSDAGLRRQDQTPGSDPEGHRAATGRRTPAARRARSPPASRRRRRAGPGPGG